MLLKVQCDNCKTKYKLDESRIQGRGAKITCPKCRNVFVVMREDGPEEDQEVEEQATVAMPTYSPAPPPELPPKPAIAVPSAPQVLRPTSADDLRWKDVGITTFKVKVAIGLVYDFSDVGTLKKYISDNRVVPTDRVSFNGKVWHILKDVGNLDDFFIDQWMALKSERLQEELKNAPQQGPTGPSVESLASLAAVEEERPQAAARTAWSDDTDSASSGGLDQDDLFDDIQGEAAEGLAPLSPLIKAPRSDDGIATKTGPTLNSDFEIEGPPTSHPSRPLRASSARRRKGGLGFFEVGTLAVLFGVCLYLGWFLAQELGHTPVINKLELKMLDRELDRAMARFLPVTMAIAQGKEVVHGLEDWTPEHATMSRSKRVIRPKVASRGPRSTRRHNQRDAGSSVTVGAITAADMYLLGQQSLKDRDYRSAAQMFRSAAEMDEQNGRYHYALGYALFGSRSYQEAEAELKKSLKLSGARSDAYKWLGDIYSRQGRKREAIEAYRNYLRTSHRDSAEIRGKLEKLTNS